MGAAADDRQPVETFGADGVDEAFGVGVRLRGADRRLDHGDAFAAEDRHVSNLFKKVCVRNRAELVSRVAELEVEGAHR